VSESLQQRVQAKRQQVIARRSQKFVLPLADYRDELAVRYKILTFEEKEPIFTRFEVDDQGVPLDKIGSSIDFLIAATEDLLEVTGKDENGNPQMTSLGQRWSTQFISDTFGVQADTVREGIRQALGSDAVMEAFKEWTEQVTAIGKDADKAAEGEPEPSVEGSPVSATAQV
jgi:hypothetical protein